MLLFVFLFFWSVFSWKIPIHSLFACLFERYAVRTMLFSVVLYLLMLRDAL